MKGCIILTTARNLIGMISPDNLITLSGRIPHDKFPTIE